MPPPVQKGLRHIFEQWDGNGAPDGLSADAVPAASRIVLASLIVVPVHRVHGAGTALESVRRGSGGVFDPAVVGALEELGVDEEFWADVAGPRIRERVLEMEPESSLIAVRDDGIDDIALAFADFIDLKSGYAASHSRRVAGVAEQVARLVGCAEEAVVQIRRAALMHDLGVLAVPSFSLEKAEERLAETEMEQYRLHPYHGERILRRVPVLAPLAEMVGNHHERVDGSGYFRGLRGEHISLGARVIAVADRLDALSHDAPGRPALSVGDALARLESESGFDPEITRAVRAAIGGTSNSRDAPLPAGLTHREVEVLRLASRGMTRARIGDQLGITENTVRHHLEHIYAKTGTSTRVGATLFAMENGLLA
jgi:HD-GYP domain-containing protein (c-di-GMP phosphodiesterase class II)